MKKAVALYRPMMDADTAFQAAVIKQFGRKNAGTMRYASRQHNAETAAAAEVFHQAAHAYLEAARADRERAATPAPRGWDSVTA